MAYSELIKNFNGIRSYLRSFYVFGFMHRDEFTQKSSRSYDNERRRIESWFGSYISFGTDRSGRRVFMTVDSRAVTENPLFQAFRTSSFTMWDIFLHFHLLDILSEDRSLSFSQILDCLAERIAYFVNGTEPDESTVRKKLKECHLEDFLYQETFREPDGIFATGAHPAGLIRKAGSGRWPSFPRSSLSG